MNSTPIEPSNAKLLIEERLNDMRLRSTLRNALAGSERKRQTAIVEIDDWDALRQTAFEIRKHSISHLADLIETFEQRAYERGMQVHYALDAGEACTIIRELLRSKHNAQIVKSKSMVTEEIGLTKALERDGHIVVETDLGEFIVQVAGEPPSHITGPAVHKSRADIGRLFSDRFGIPYTDDPNALTQFARTHLRDAFRNADVGITGANFAIAETGELCIVENEGNARLTMALPDVHIAVVGMEKFIPDRRALAVMLEVLARSATGQRLTSYTSIVSARKGKATHVIILDNGRSRLLAHHRLRDTLLCIRCGACMNTCPVYQTVGGHAYGSVYPGPIGAVLSPTLFGYEQAKTLPYMSSLCGACADVCPVKIDIHHLLLEQRGSVVRSKLTSFGERIAMRLFLFCAANFTRFRIATKIFRLSTFFIGRKSHITFRKITLPAPAKKSFRTLWKEKR